MSVLQVIGPGIESQARSILKLGCGYCCGAGGTAGAVGGACGGSAGSVAGAGCEAGACCGAGAAFGAVPSVVMPGPCESSAVFLLSLRRVLSPVVVGFFFFFDVVSPPRPNGP